MAASRLSSRELREEAMAELKEAIGVDLWCWSLADPVSLLPLSGVSSPASADPHAELVPWQLVLEQHDHAATRPGVAVASEPVATLAQATGGDLRRSTRWVRCVQPRGMGDVLVWACRDAHGCWGWLEAIRADDRKAFGEEDRSLLAALSEPFGRALRCRAARSAAAASATPSPDILVLDADLRVASWTPNAPEWLAQLPGGNATEHGLLPAVIYAVAGRATAATENAHLTAQALLPTLTGSWAIVEGLPLRGPASDRVALTIRAAEATEVAPRLARILQLTPRERQLASLAAAGLSTAQIAKSLYLSPYTVKDHFKSIFAKTGVHSRRELAITLTGGAPTNPAVPASPRLRPQSEPHFPTPPANARTAAE
jgi:DNA-binding NarL/FixJ family response regulator